MSFVHHGPTHPFPHPHAPLVAPQEQLKEEVLLMARRVLASNLQMLLIDTENKFVSTGFAEEIAKAAGAKYYYLPNASDKSIAAATTSAMNEAKISP